MANYQDYNTEDRSLENISKINAAGLINLTLKDLWEDFYKHIRASDYNKASKDLDCLWVEFGGDEEENSQNFKIYYDIELKIAEQLSKIPVVNGFKKYGRNYSETLNKLYRLIIKKALFLRKLQNKQGKGTAYKDSSDDYMD